jgi:hypothetical protein
VAIRPPGDDAMILIREGKLGNGVKGLERGKVFLLEEEIWLQADDYLEFLDLKCPRYRLYETNPAGTYHLAIAGAHITVQVEQYIARWRKLLGEYPKS